MRETASLTLLALAGFLLFLVLRISYDIWCMGRNARHLTLFDGAIDDLLEKRSAWTRWVHRWTDTLAVNWPHPLVAMPARPVNLGL